MSEDLFNNSAVAEKKRKKEKALAQPNSPFTLWFLLLKQLEATCISRDKIHENWDRAMINHM
jgi:hypothetical protein